MDRETQVLDINAEYLGVPTEQLMENAGIAAAREAAQLPHQRWLVICGPGNNGGDGYVAARHLKQCTVMTVGHPKTALAAKNFRRVKAQGIPVHPYEKETFVKMLQECDAVMDAMLGVGVSGPLREPYREIVDILNRSEVFVLSLDVPTGFGTETPLAPDMTVTFHRIKEGMDDACGEVVVADIGIPKEAEEYVGPGEFIYYPKPAETSHKGDNGVVAVVGGGPYTGAPALAALAALRTGCDLAYVCTPHPAWQVVASFSPNLIVRRMEGAVFSEENIQEIEDIIERADAVLLGPGLGNSTTVGDACLALIERYGGKKWFVVDADAIEIFGERDCGGRVIFTPHAGEFRALTGIVLPDDLEERRRIVEEEARKRHATILLKGSVDIISDGHRTKMNRIHNEGMTVGGTGDVLAGICTALLAKGVEPLHAACLAAMMNGMAGNLAFEEKSYGMVAGDVVERIPDVLRTFVA